MRLRINVTDVKPNRDDSNGSRVARLDLTFIHILRGQLTQFRAQHFFNTRPTNDSTYYERSI